MPLTLKEACLRSAGGKRRELRFLRDDSIIEARAKLLEPDERDLVRAVLIFGQPAMMVAKLARISPDAVRYRVRKLVERISSPEFVGAARSLHLFDAVQAIVARHHILQGKSLRATASATGMPCHVIRRSLAEINGIIKGIRGLKKHYPSLERELQSRNTAMGASAQARSPRNVKCTA